MAKTADLTCSKCRQPARWLTETEAGWVGACCVPESLWKQYPAWRKREESRHKHAEMAKKNFRHERIAA